MNSEDRSMPLTEKEYYAIREFFGFVSAIQRYGSILKRRAEKTDGTWEEIERISRESENVLHNLLITIPVQKLQLIQRELPNIRVTVETVPERGRRKKTDEYAYVPTKDLETLIQKTIDWNCFACEKTGREIEQCPISKAVEAVYPFRLPGDSSKSCKFSGLNLGEEE